MTTQQVRRLCSQPTFTMFGGSRETVYAECATCGRKFVSNPTQLTEMHQRVQEAHQPTQSYTG